MKLIDITVFLKHETESAVLITEDGETDIWLPKSQVEYNLIDQKKDLYEVTLPEWLAKEKGLI